MLVNPAARHQPAEPIGDNVQVLVALAYSLAPQRVALQQERTLRPRAVVASSWRNQRAVCDRLVPAGPDHGHQPIRKNRDSAGPECLGEQRCAGAWSPLLAIWAQATGSDDPSSRAAHVDAGWERAAPVGDHNS